MASTASAQMAGASGEIREYVLGSDWLTNPTDEFAVLFQEVIHEPDTPWVRIGFGEVELKGGSYLRITSLFDGAVQYLDAQSIQDWEYTSAFFNGSAVLVELVAAPWSRGNRVDVSHLAVGLLGVGGPISPWPGEADDTPLTICDAADTRVLVTDPAVCRIIHGAGDAYCTGFIIGVEPGPAGNSILLTAGHCLCNTCSSGPRHYQMPNIAEFNVPLSLNNCLVQHPPPAHQYPITRFVGRNAGIGEDWGVFRVASVDPDGPGPLPARQPHQGQGGAPNGAIKAQAGAMVAPGAVVRVNGHGLDCPTVPGGQLPVIGDGPCVNNQTLQTATGTIPAGGVQPGFLQHRVDTTGGNSGSPIMNTAGQVVGIHTHGGCAAAGAGANHGTRIDHPSVQRFLTAALAGNLPAGMNCLVPDIAGPAGGGPDGFVTVDDVFAVLAAWGATPALPALVAADIDGNGVVNIVDLFLVLAKWGPCQGACCTGAACAVNSKAACIAAGGFYIDDDFPCFPQLCPVGPFTSGQCPP